MASKKSIDAALKNQYTAPYEKIFAYTRDTDTEHLLVVCNFSAESLGFDAPENFRGAEMLLNNYAEDSEDLRPYEAVMLYYHD